MQNGFSSFRIPIDNTHHQPFEQSFFTITLPPPSITPLTPQQPLNQLCIFTLSSFDKCPHLQSLLHPIPHQILHDWSGSYPPTAQFRVRMADINEVSRRIIQCGFMHRQNLYSARF